MTSSLEVEREHWLLSETDRWSPAHLPEHLGRLIPRPTASARAVWQGDVLMLHNTARLDPATFRDNPILALVPPYGAYYGLMDGHRCIGDIHQLVGARTGWTLPAAVLESFCRHLQHCGFISWDTPSTLAQWSDDEAIPWDMQPWRLQRLMERFPVPFYVSTELTYHCMCTCASCYVGAEETQAELSDAEHLHHVVSSVIDAGITYVTLLGGEPLLRPRLLLDAIIRYREANLFVKLITNGLLLDCDMVSALDEAGVNKVELSLNGFTPEVDRLSRDPRLHGATIRAMAALQSSDIPQVGLSVTLGSFNFTHVLAGLGDFVREHGVTKVYFSRFYRSANCSDDLWELTDQQRAALLDATVRWNEELADVPGFEAAVLDDECSCGRSSVVITPGGYVKHCPFTRVVDRANCLSGRATLLDIWRGDMSGGVCNVFSSINSSERNVCLTRVMREHGIETQAE